MRVALMSTCIGDAMFPDAVRATVRLLRRLGVQVEVPEAQTCCGQPMVNTGYLDEAVPLVRTFVEAFEGFDAVVVPSGSCAGSVRHQHSLVAARAGDPALADAVQRTAPRTHELSEFLVDVLGRGRRGGVVPAPRDLPPDVPLAADARCRRPARTAARAVRGLGLLDLPHAEECCGFGGTFAVKNADTSVAMGSDKARTCATRAPRCSSPATARASCTSGAALATARGRADHAPRRGARATDDEPAVLPR